MRQEVERTEKERRGGKGGERREEEMRGDKRRRGEGS